MDGLRGEDSIAELCRREGISQGVYYKWSKDFIEAWKKRLAGDTARAASTDEVKELRREARDLKEVVAEQTLELRLLKKSYRIRYRMSGSQRVRNWSARPRAFPDSTTDCRYSSFVCARKTNLTSATMTNKELDTDTYALKSEAVTEFAAPELNYRPPMPRAYSPRIGLIGAGVISASHLDAYRTAGWEVAAICNRTRSKAESRAAEFYPDAFITDIVEEFLADATIDIVDITPIPPTVFRLSKLPLSLANTCFLKSRSFLI